MECYGFSSIALALPLQFKTYSTCSKALAKKVTEALLGISLALIPTQALLQQGVLKLNYTVQMVYGCATISSAALWNLVNLISAGLQLLAFWRQLLPQLAFQPPFAVGAFEASRTVLDPLVAVGNGKLVAFDD